MARDNQHRGLILDRTLTYVLLMLAEQEGVVRGKGRKLFGKLRLTKLLEKTKADLLSSVLIYGGLRVVCSDQLATVTDLSALTNENIPVSTHLPYDLSQLQRLHGIYQNALKHARFFDFEPRTARLISYDALASGRLKYADDLEFETEIEEYKYWTGLLSQEIDWVVGLAPELFSLFLRKQNAFGSSFNDYYREEYVGDAHEKNKFDTPSDVDVLQLMDLDLMTPDQLEGFVTGDFHFGLPGNYFENFVEFDNESEINAQVQTRGEQLKQMIQRRILASMHHTERFVQAHAFWKAYLEMNVLIKLSSSSSSQIKLLSDSRLNATYPISKEEERLQLYRLFVAEINAVPRIESFSDLFRLYNHKYVRRFRKKLNEWTDAVNQGEVKLLKKMRRDFELATKDLASAARMQRVANVLTVVSLPVAVGGMLTGLPLDFAFTAVGPALLAYSTLKERSASWVRFGSVP